MHFTELSHLMAVLWSSLFIAVIFYIRKKERISQLSEVLCLVFLYLFSVIRMIVSVDFIPSIGIDISGALSDFYKVICITKRNFGIVSFTIIQLIYLVCTLVMIIKLFTYFRQYRKVIRWVSTFRKYEGLEETKDKVSKTIGKKIEVDIRRGWGIDSPVGIGIFRKFIVLPDRTYDSEELYYILLHEYNHFYNHDLLVKVLSQIYICIFWWNPAVYLLKKDLDHSLEIKCDLASVKNMSIKEVEHYLKTIIKVIKESGEDRPYKYGGIIALAKDNGDELVERFAIIVENQHKKSSSTRTVVYAAIFALMFVLSYSFMPKPYYEPQGKEIEMEKDDIEYNTKDVYLYLQKDGEYRLIKKGEFNIPVNQDGVEFYKSQGFEIKEEK